jgi:hypothetical protein
MSLVIIIFWTSLCFAESPAGNKDIIIAAQQYIDGHSPGIKYKLILSKKVDNYALVNIIPLQKDLDPAFVILERVSGKWIGRELTTDKAILKEYPKLSK